MASMRAKFWIGEVLRRVGTSNEVLSEQLVMHPIASGEKKEDQAFWEATPAGRLEMTITNKDLYGQFLPGDKYYLDFTKVEN